MKRLRFLAPMFFLIGASLFAQNISLDGAIQSCAKKIEARLPQKAKVAIFDFDTPSQALSVYVIDKLVEVIVESGNLIVTERKDSDAIRKEMTIQLSGDVSDDEARAIGHQLGAQFILTGTLQDIGEYSFRIKAIDVESGQIVATSSETVDEADPRIVRFMPNQSNVQPTVVTQASQPTITQSNAEPPAATQATQPAITQTTAISYQIGSDDTVSAMNRTLRDGDEDTFLLVPNFSGSIIVETTGNVDTYMEFYNAETNILLTADDDSGSGYNARIRYDVQSGRRYTVKVIGLYDSGNYGFRAYREKVYRVGERGPAGGIIFYDQGQYRNGWRYLEAAPANTEFKSVAWGTSRIDVPGTRTELGSGKENTRIIVEYLRRNNETGKAAQLCDQLRLNNFSDWFLPSLDELNWMFLNLKKNGWGNFISERYWSSSQYNASDVWYRHFGEDGRASHNYGKNTANTILASMYVRAIRSF